MTAESHGIVFDMVNLNGVSLNVSSICIVSPGALGNWTPKDEAEWRQAEMYWDPAPSTNPWRKVSRFLNGHHLPKRLRKK